MNTLTSLIETFPGQEWCWFELSRNENITIDYMRENRRDWRAQGFLRNPNLTLELLSREEVFLSNLEEESLWYFLSSNPNLTPDFVEKNLYRPWNWTSLSCWVPMDLVFRYWDCPWDWLGLASNPNLDLEFFTQSLGEQSFFWSYLSSNPGIKPDFIEKNLNRPWNWYILSKNPNLSLEFLDQYSDQPWDWFEIGKSSKIDLDFVLRHSEQPLIWDGFSKNPYVTELLVESHLDLPWSWNSLSENPNITPQFLEKYPTKGWSWFLLSRNPNLTFDFISQNLDKGWNWGLSGLSSNLFDKHPRLIRTVQIQRWFRRDKNRKNSLKLIVLKERLNLDLILYIGEKFIWR